MIMPEFTERELEILYLADLSNEDTGEVLGISWATAKAHWRRILLKLGAKNRADAAAKWNRLQKRKQRPPLEK